MNIAAVDLETYLITPHNRTPKLVCMSWATERACAVVTGAQQSAERLTQILDEGYTIVAHNGAHFDFPVMLTQFDPASSYALANALERGRALCTKLWAQMADVAEGLPAHPGGYSLDKLCKRYGVPVELDKSNPWRLRYAELDGVPLDAWPPEARTYALDDARALYALAHKLRPTVDVGRKTEQHTYLALSSARGTPIDLVAVESWGRDLITQRDSLREELSLPIALSYDPAFEDMVREDGADLTAAYLATDYGSILRPDGSRDMRVVRKLLDAPGAKRTKASAKFPDGQVSTDREACEASPLPVMRRYSEYLQLEDAINRELSFLMDSGGRVHTSYGLADSGRTTSAKPALQNIGNRSGARKAFVAEPGALMVVGDYSMLELSCIAQVCVATGCGDRLARALRSGEDLHSSLGARLAAAGIQTRDSDPKYLRRLAKEANFGFNGGMGEQTLMTTARKRGIVMTPEEAKILRNVWKSERPDVLAYHRLIQAHLDRTGGLVDHYRSGRVRGGLSFTQAANTLFQGLGADVTLDAFVQLSKAGYMPQLFVHDEFHFSIQHPSELTAIEEICNQVSRDWLPAAPSRINAAIVNNWSEKQ